MVEWLQAVTSSKGGHGETKVIQVKRSELAWDRQTPAEAFAQSTPPDSADCSECLGWVRCMCVCELFQSVKEKEKVSGRWVNNALKAPLNIPEMTLPVLKIHTKVVILFMEANLAQIQNLQTT